MSKEFFKDIKFYYLRMDLPFRKIVKLVKIMYSEGVHFENAKQILSERKKIRELESDQDKWSSRLNTLKNHLMKVGYTIMSNEQSKLLEFAYPKQSKLRFDVAKHFTLDDMDRKDADEIYLIMYDLFNKGWSYNRPYDDPTFYYYDKKNFLKWASHPRETEFDFNAQEPKRKYTRVNYAEVMDIFKTRRRVCSYEGFLDWVRMRGLVGGGKNGPDNLWDSSFSRGIPSPKDGYSYNEGFVFAELRLTFDKPSVVSFPINCFDNVAVGAESGSSYDFKIHNRSALEDNKHAFEFYRLISVKSEINVYQNSPSRVLINESAYKYSVFNDNKDFVDKLIDNSKTTKCVEDYCIFSIYTEAWRYMGCKEIYDGSYSKSLISGLDEHLFYNIIVDPMRSPTNIVIYFIFKVQFFSRFLGSTQMLDEYYDLVENDLCAECEEEKSEMGDDIPGYDKNLDEESLSNADID